MRVVLADDSILLREGVARLLEDSGFDVVGQAGNAEELLLKVRSYGPQVAIVDIRMPPSHTDEGLRAAREIREKYPDTGVLVLSQYVEPEYALDLLSESAEGVGYLLKDRVADGDELAVLTSFVAAIERGEGSLAVIEGTAGIGKTRLLAETRARATTGVRVLPARGGELEGDFAFGVVRQLFEPLLATATPERREE